MSKLSPIIIIDPKKKAELEKDPAVHVLTHDKLGDSIALRLPDRARWRRFKADLTSEVPDKADLANEAFVLDLVVFPERAQVSQYFEQRPAAADVFARGIADLVGFGGKAEKKD
jgi:hypothetical protein